MHKDDFEFWCEFSQVEKAVDEKTGEEIMLLGGIASTIDEDSDGEFLDPKGFDIKPLLKSGLVNWHHQAKTNPGTIVGEPTKAEIRKEGLYIETRLYPHSQVACDIWDLAKTLAKDSKTRRLGYSIEGRVVERKSDDPTDPDYKKIIKAVITGVAITHQPKNPKTFANIIKGEIDDFDEDGEDIKEKENHAEKEDALDTESAAALKKESVDDDLKVTTFSKSEVFGRIFQDIPGISIEKAKQIYSLIEKISLMKKKSMLVTEDDIQKAYETLGLEVPVLDISKADDDEDSEEDETEDYSGEDSEEDSEEDETKVKKSEDSDEDEDEDEIDDDEETEEDSEEDEDEETEEDETEVKKAQINELRKISKGISDSRRKQEKYMKALGVMVKAQSIQLVKAQESLNSALDTIERQEDIIKGYENQLNSLNERISEIGGTVPAPKSLRHARPVERAFAKGNDNDFAERQNGGLAPNQISINNRSAISEILDQATFAKGGFDAEFSKACTAFEAGATLPASILTRIKNEFGIEIVN